jgi:hypothetical protein
VTETGAQPDGSAFISSLGTPGITVLARPMLLNQLDRSANQAG